MKRKNLFIKPLFAIFALAVLAIFGMQNISARGSSGGGANTVGLVLSTLNNPFFGLLYKSSGFQQRGYRARQ